MTAEQEKPTLVIDDSCINCDMCIPECPSNSIYMGNKHYHIETQTCILCENYYTQPKCIEVCPIDSIAFKKT